MSVCEWLIVLAAYAYEVLDKPIMSDSEYDMRSATLAASGTVIPGFSPYTGQWVKELKLDMLEKVYKASQGYYANKYDVQATQVNRALDALNIKYHCCNGDACK